MKKRILALLCAVAAAVGLLLPMASGASYDDIYLVGVNDTVLLGLITHDRMPVMRGGVLYAPYTVLDNSGLRLSYALNRTDGLFTIYTREKALIFQTTGAGATDKAGNEYSDRVITRNGTVYIPLRFVATFFGLTYSYYTVTLPDGSVPIARLCSEDAALNNHQFGVSVSQLVTQPLAQYLASLATPTPSAPTPSPSRPAPATPTPAPPTAAPPSPTPSAEPLRPATVYLAVRCTDGGGFAQILETLADRRRSALFLFSPDELAQRDNDARAAAAAGHQIGLLLPAEGAQAAFEEGNRLLSHILHTGATQVAFEEGEAQPGNWQVWSPNLTLRGRTVAQRLENLALDLQQRAPVVRLTVTDTAGTAQVLRSAIGTLTASPYTLRTPTETDP